MIKNQKILNTKVDIISISESIDIINKWITENKIGRYVCLFNVHMCMEAFDDSNFLKVVNDANLVLADGFPIYFAQKLLGHSNASKIRGVDLTIELSKFSKINNIPIGFLGGTDRTLKKMSKNMLNKYNIDNIQYSYSPPFRLLNEDENNDIIKKINDSGIKILFVGLGCPKQEFWMSEHRIKLNCILIGVGAAFDFLSGYKKTAPLWMQKIGLEWLHRFYCEPKRLWKRYLKHNPRFIYYFIKQIYKKN